MPLLDISLKILLISGLIKSIILTKLDLLYILIHDIQLLKTKKVSNMSEDKTKEEGLKNTIHALASIFDQSDEKNMLEVFPIATINHYRNFLDESIEDFDVELSSNINGLLLHLLKDTEHANNESLLTFYYLYEFVSIHVVNLIQKIEGSPCSHDKSSWVLNVLEKYLKTGIETVPNYQQEYTFHLPKKVFTSTEDIHEFFKALSRLYYGNPDNYLAFIHKTLVATKENQQND